MAAISGQQSAFSYDGKADRLKATRDGVTTYYIYDMNGNVLAEADGNKNITKYYIHGNGLLEMITNTDQTYTYHFDPIGSTVAMTDMNENIVNSYAYTPFGVLTESETIPQPFKYVGQYGVMHEPNGLYYMRARYYDPELGRFISEDPIGFAGGTVNLYEYVDSVGKPIIGTNLYEYANSNPIRYIDPYGLFGWDTIIKWIMKKGAKWGLKDPMDKIVPPFHPAIPEEGDDDNDGIPNFQDPDSDYCIVNCEIKPEKCH